MSLNGKRDGFEDKDFFALAKRFNISTSRARAMLQQVQYAVSLWPQYAKDSGVSQQRIISRQKLHRL
jgi:hypothetical protein